MAEITIDIEALFAGDGNAKLDRIPDYLSQAKALAGKGNDVTLTGRAPIWLYLIVAHELHGVARKLMYESPVTGKIVIFDHDPFPAGHGSKP